MGAWDYGALDNDPALDVIQRWEEWVAGPNSIGYEEAINRYFVYWGDAVNYGDAITNMEVIALVAIHLNNQLPIPKRLIKAAEHAISRELVPDELESWAEPEKRKEVLSRLLTEIGGMIRRVRPPKIFRDPAIHYKNTTDARRDLLRLANIVRPQGRLGLSQLMYHSRESAPPFLQTVHRLMMHRIWEKDWKIEEQASTERRMMLAWYLGLTSGMTIEEIADLL